MKKNKDLASNETIIQITDMLFALARITGVGAHRLVDEAHSKPEVDKYMEEIIERKLQLLQEKKHGNKN